MALGVLYGVGVGPGNSALITEKGKQALAASSLICVPKSKAERESVALQAALPHIAQGTHVEELLFPMTRDEHQLEAHWRQAAQRVSELLEEHAAVSFLTIGDPLLYSTFGYLLQGLRALKPEVRVEIIPGISSFNAAASLLQIPLVEKNERLAVVPVPVADDEFSALSRHIDTFVFLKISAAFDATLDIIERAGIFDDVYLVSRCGSGDEYWTNDPFALRGKPVDYLSLLIAKRRKG